MTATAPAPVPPQQILTRFEVISTITTAALFVVLAFVAWLSYHQQPLAEQVEQAKCWDGERKIAK